MRRTCLVLLPCTLLALASTPAGAVTCTLDAVPAATLLLPYFEVDLDDAGGRTTALSIGNASHHAALAHVVVWTDLAVPTFVFDVYLTGYELQTINLRDVFEGKIPVTADLARDPEDRLSPRGELSEDAAFPGCENLDGVPEPFAKPLWPVLPPGAVADLRSLHTGGPAAGLQGRCAGLAHGDHIARGYVTIDVARRCSPLAPDDPGYFGPDGVATNDNILWGDYYSIDSRENSAQGTNLVRVEADPENFGAGDYTFYARYVGASGADAREPLATTWAARFLEGGPFTAGTGLVIWRDSKRPSEPFACGGRPPGHPFSQGQVVWFDEEENPTSVETANLFPFASGKVRTAGMVGSTRSFGWLYLDLNHSTGGPLDPYAQSWIGTVLSASGRYSAGLEGTQLDSACGPARCVSGEEAEAGQLCLLGPIEAGSPARFRVVPRGCFSSSCTTRREVSCSVAARNGSTLVLDSLFCLQTATTGGCTTDCNGGGFARCSSAALAAGTYTARLGSLSLTFTVPGPGVCVGSPF